LELAHTLRQLWRLRLAVVVIALLALLVAAATAYRVSVLPPSLESKSYEFGAASTTMMVDSTTSPVVNLEPLFAPLVNRAGVYARLMTSAPVREYIGREIGVPGEAIVAEGPPDGTVTRAAREPTPGERANAIRNEGKFYRLDLRTQDDLPIVSVNAQARTADEAAALANAAITGFKKYAAALDRQQRVPEDQRVILRRLGEAQGGLVNSGVGKVVPMMTFVATFGLGLVLLLLTSSVARSWRVAAAEEQWMAAANGAAVNGHVDLEPYATGEERDDDRLSARA
jgi:hypothetical protein